MTLKLRPTPIIAVIGALCTFFSSLRAQNPVPSAPRSLLGGSSYQSTIPVSAPAPTQAPAAPSAPAAGPAPAPQTVAAGGDYVLSPSDTVEMTVFHEPDLTTDTRIASDGTAQLPLIGELKLGGMAIRDARELIRRRYNADYLVEPQVYLNVVGYAHHKFTILGQVEKPGDYEFPPGEHLSLLEAVGIAGGFTRLAAESSVTVKRVANGPEQTITVNARKLTTKSGKPFELQAGDVISVGESWF
jgi:protein involved in polysaccharide export with SLBB domain